ncbi:bacterial luciferase-like protein [Teratosphaeria nubilosa]|uniref:Bacterial luciferase-like protein n=1 Tax=Teratosphaeria nubilosa TaxID=161662 RepID=A0A6G1KV91_9PEZI|nr:bacterial luciferase-like protein [Teratosphaeria nubilosa]
MPVEFISLAFPNPSTELHPLPSAQPVDADFLKRYARNLDDYGYDYTLQPYDSGGADPWTMGATIGAATTNLKVIVAVRPNTVYPTWAAKSLATLDQLTKGRAVVHFIAGGSDAEQAREGDFLSKEERYGRLEEYIRILRRAWESAEPFDWEGKFYQFRNFSNRIRPVNGRIPISVGGSSPEAYRVGGALADIFGLWGEPLRETKEQIDLIDAEAERAGRTDRPRIWVTFRPIVAETEELAWGKAQRTLEALRTHPGLGRFAKKAPGNQEPQNAGSRRLLEIAKKGEVQDRGLWYPTVTATNARGASTALVGTPQIVADTILDYVDLGCELISIRGYDNLNDAVQYGREILPLVRRQLKEGRGKERRGKEERVVPEVKKKMMIMIMIMAERRRIS